MEVIINFWPLGIMPGSNPNASLNISGDKGQLGIKPKGDALGCRKLSHGEDNAF